MLPYRLMAQSKLHLLCVKADTKVLPVKCCHSEIQLLSRNVLLTWLQFCLVRIVKNIYIYISFSDTVRTKTVGFYIVLLIIQSASNKKYLLRSMSCGNYINLLNWNYRGLESLNQGHPSFAQLRAVLAS